MMFPTRQKPEKFAHSRLDARTWIWFCVLAFASVGLSFVFACATPFVALATLAAIKMSRRSGLSIMIVAWLANQIVGYEFLGYPRTSDSLMWGVAIGASALVGFCAARVSMGSSSHGVVRGIIGFSAAFVGYESLLYAAQLPLGSSAEGFSLSVIGYISATNVVALIGLLSVHRLGTWIGLATETNVREPANRLGPA